MTFTNAETPHARIERCIVIVPKLEYAAEVREVRKTAGNITDDSS